MHPELIESIPFSWSHLEVISHAIPGELPPDERLMPMYPGAANLVWVTLNVANLPFGIISHPKLNGRHPAVAIEGHVLVLSIFANHGGFDSLADFSNGNNSVFLQPTLNQFAGLGRSIHRKVHAHLREVLREDTQHPGILKDNLELRALALVPLSEIETHLPMSIGDYTDFFAGRNHAHNVGTLFRGPDNALNPNYNHVPVAYHGRASSVVVSGTPLYRPWGQILPNPGAKEPIFQPCKKLDYELELGMFICQGNSLGQPVAVDDAEEYIFGYVLMNDWSARDIQQWEYVPLGPFNAKNFGTTISPWVVLADVLEPFKTKGLQNDVELQSYLREARKENVNDIQLEVMITTAAGNKKVLTSTSGKNLIWSWPQMLSHHTIAGCNLRTGDLLGSGTISGTDPGTQGSMLEQSKGGKTPIEIEGEERCFVDDGDTITIRGWAGEGDSLICFGECVGPILAPIPRK